MATEKAEWRRIFEKTKTHKGLTAKKEEDTDEEKEGRIYYVTLFPSHDFLLQENNVNTVR